MALAKALLIAVAVGYLALAALLWLFQERLIFLPRAAAAKAAAPPGWLLESVTHRTHDGIEIAGVLVRPGSGRLPLVIYYGGNAEEVTAYGTQVQQAYGERAVLLVNYRGYGASRGRPAQRTLIADALELFDWAASRPDIDASRIALHGRSLGAAIAVAVAAARPAKCVVLTSPFASARELARELYPWLPVAWLLRHPFDSVALAPAIEVPVLILAGEADTIIPQRHSDRLAERWGGPVERRSFAGFGHNDLDLHPGYVQAIRGFLDRTL